jgi:hypothetical protein
VIWKLPMAALYRTRLWLPSLLLALSLVGCGDPPPPPQETERPGNVYSEALDEARAAAQSAEQHNAQEQRIDDLLDR